MKPIKEKVEQEEEIVNNEVQKAETIKADCDADLSRVLPIKRRAEKDLKTLTSNDMILLKNMKKPP